MTQQDLPDDVRALIVEHINSVVELEALLLLYASGSKEWSPEQVGRELRIDPAWARSQLDDLTNDGLIARRDEGGGGYRFAPRTSELAAAVQGLAEAYNDRRVTVISLIYSKPVDKIRVFADAFRLRKDKPDG